MKKQYIGRSIALLLSFLLILCCGPITAFGQAPQENSQIVQSSEIEQSSLPEQENLIEQVSEPEQSSQPEQISEPVQESQSIQESQPEQSSQLAQESQVEQPSQPNYAPTSGIASNDIQTRAIDGPNTVEVGGEIELTGSDGYFHDWEYSSRDGGKVTIEENWRDGSEVTVTGVSAGRVTITHSYYNWYWREETFVLDVTSPNGNKIEAGVYLRYSNEVPRNINQDSEAADLALAETIAHT